VIKITKQKSINKQLGEETLCIEFKYNPDYVSKIKSLPIPKRTYHSSSKTWEAHLSTINQIMEIFDKSELLIDEDVDLDFEEETTNSEFNVNYFYDTLGKIQDDAVREFTLKALECLPEYFWKVPASSTGKYHPQYALGEGGLLRHTKACLLIAEELFKNTLLFDFTEIEKDIARSALHLHDGVKHGLEGSQYTVSEHPLEVTKYIQSNPKLLQHIGMKDWELIKECIETHMGQWTQDFKTGEEVLQPPTNNLQKFVHLVDYLSSRKVLEVNFSG
jgi:hypothetical protein